jgi:hypothetical protein
MWWWIVAGCSVDGPLAPWSAAPPPPAITIVDVDPLVRGTPVRVSVRYDGMVPGATMRLVANRGGRGSGPCDPTGVVCVDLTGPVRLSAPRVLAASQGRARFEVELWDSASAGLQLVVTDGVRQFTSGVFVRPTRSDADRDEDGLMDRDEVQRGTDLWSDDTDLDGFLDGEEVGLGSDPLDPVSVPAEQCGSLVDEDRDGLLDCQDPECVGAPPCVELCEGGADEDLDGLADCEDPECVGAPPCVELCQGGADEDLDGLADCQDPECVGAPPCVELCQGGADEDLDGLADCQDADCAGFASCVEDCDSGRDDDADGLVDCEDEDCMTSINCFESDCSDGQDGDDDSYVDCADEDCWGSGCLKSSLEIFSGTASRINVRSKSFPYRDCSTTSPGMCDTIPGVWSDSLTEQLRYASGELKTYNESGFLIGSCLWQANHLRNVHREHSWRTDYWIEIWYINQIMYSDPSPVLFGPGCVSPNRGDVFPPTVRGQADGTLVWSRAWGSVRPYAIIPEAPYQPWAVGDHTRVEVGDYFNGRTTDVWTNLHTPTPLLRHFAP